MARKPVKFEVNPLLGGPSLEARNLSGSPYRELQMAEIDVDPDQPRRMFDEAKLAELAASIEQYGVLSPILVRVTAGGTYRVVAGERRFRACQKLGRETIPAIIDYGEGIEGDALTKQLTENIQREDLNSLERALAIGRLRDQHQWSIREIASKLGLSKGVVQRSLEVLDLPDDLQAALRDGFSESKILLLSKVESRDLRTKLLEKLDGLTREELEQRIEEALGSEKGKGAYHGGTKKKRVGRMSTEDRRIVEEIQTHLSTKAKIRRKRSNASQGFLTLEFYSDEDLQEVFRRLTS